MVVTLARCDVDINLGGRARRFNQSSELPQQGIRTVNREEFKQLYDERLPLYDRLVANVHGVLASQLDDAGVPYVNVDKRVKSLDSAFEKVARKRYSDPFNQIEDFCGLRVVCYYPSDVDKIVSLLRQEFTVTSEEDTKTRLKANEFGYRSTHLAILIPEDWLKAPQY